MRQAQGQERDFGDWVYEVPEVGTFYLWQLDVLNDIWFIHLPPLKLSSPMVLRRHRKKMLNDLDGHTVFCHCDLDDPVQARFARWFGFEDYQTHKGKLWMRRT